MGQMEELHLGVLPSGMLRATWENDPGTLPALPPPLLPEVWVNNVFQLRIVEEKR